MFFLGGGGGSSRTFEFDTPCPTTLSHRCILKKAHFVLLLQTNAKIKVVDNMIGRLWNGLKDRCLEDKINIIMVGDHGSERQYSESLDLILTNGFFLVIELLSLTYYKLHINISEYLNCK